MTAVQRPLRILQLNTTYGVGGITRHVLDLSRWLRDHGQTVFFGGTPGPWLSPETEPDFLVLDARKVSGEGRGLARRLSYALASARKLRRWLKRRPVDLIHAHETAPALIARLASLGLGVPIALTYHGSEPERVRQYSALARFAADLVISASHRGGRDLVARGGLPRERLRVIGYGVRPPPSVEPDRVATTRAALIGAEGRLLVVTIARICEQKGIDVLIDVVQRVLAERSDVHFVLVGDGPDQAKAEGWAAAAGVSNWLHFAGRSEEPHLYLAAADLFLLTSRWEALPFTIVEAFQTGTPAVATDCGGVAELIDDSVGRVTAVGDAEALARAVISLAEDKAARARMSAAALARSREARFSPDHIHQELLAAYRGLTAGK